MPGYQQLRDEMNDAIGRRVESATQLEDEPMRDAPGRGDGATVRGGRASKSRNARPAQRTRSGAHKAGQTRPE